MPLKINEVLSSFQEEVKRAIGEEDYQCHYDLGLSYMDLGFYDEALAEFGVARRLPELELRSIEMAGRCFVEKGDVELEASIVIYERGEALRAHCDGLLRKAEARVEKISVSQNGEPAGSEPLDVKD